MSEPQQQSRGRPVVSKPLYSPPSTSKSVPPAAVKGKGSSNKTTLERTRSTVSSAKPAARSNSSAKIPGQTSSHETGDNFKVTKLSSTTVNISSTSWTPPLPPAKIPPPPTSQQQQNSFPATDSLQLSAQVYSWTYMSSTLDACFKSAEEAAMNDLETLRKELTAEESEMSEKGQRLDAQRAIEFYEVLASELFAKEAPAIMQKFHSHGDSCAKIEEEVLNLASSCNPNADDEEPLKPYSKMLDDLEELQNEAESLQNSIIKLTGEVLATPEKNQNEHKGGNGNTPDASKSNNDSEVNTAQQQIMSVFAACLPVLKARVANLSMAQDLVDSALENASLSLRMESLGIAD